MPGVASLLFFLTLGGSLGFLVAGAASLFSIPALLLLIATLAVFWTLLRALLAAAGRAGPAVSRTGVFASALGRASIVIWLATFLLLGMTHMAGQRPDWLGSGAVVGLLIGLPGWAIYANDQLTRARALKAHGHAIEEATRLAELDNVKDGEDKLKESLLNCELAFGSQHLQSARCALDLARYYQTVNDRKRAAAMFRRALRLQQKLLGKDDARNSPVLLEWINSDDNLAGEEAMELLQGALQGLEREHGAGSLSVALTHERLGELQGREGKTSEAEASLRQAYESLGALGPARSGETLRVGLKLARLLSQKDATTVKAAALLKELEPLRLGQPPAMQLEALLCRLQVSQARGDDTATSEAAWQALTLMQNEMGPQKDDFKPIWQACLPLLAAPYGDPAVEPVFTALLGGDSFALRNLLTTHPDWVTETDGSGWTFLQWACFFGHERLLDTFVSLGASPDGTGGEWPPLQIACRWGHRRLISVLAARVTSVSAPSPEGWVALHRCAQNGEDRLLDLLPDKDLDLEIANGRGDTALSIACRGGAYRLVTALVAKGADVNHANPNSGRTPLHEAAYVGHSAIAECLLLNGADGSLKDAQGLTAEELAEQAEQSAMVQQLRRSQKGLA